MEVHFRNRYGPKVWVAIMRYDPVGCGAYGNWATQGWWGIDRDQEVWAFSTDNRYSAFYAEAEDGTVWTGPQGPVYVYLDAFDSCLNIGSTGARGVVGMQLIDGDSSGVHTVNLVP